MINNNIMLHTEKSFHTKNKHKNCSAVTDEKTSTQTGQGRNERPGHEYSTGMDRSRHVHQNRHKSSNPEPNRQGKIDTAQLRRTSPDTATEYQTRELNGQDERQDTHSETQMNRKGDEGFRSKHITEQRYVKGGSLSLNTRHYRVLYLGLHGTKSRKTSKKHRKDKTSVI